MTSPGTRTEEFAPAKVNLALRITGRRADGYHQLESLVVFCLPADRLSATPADTLSLTVGGPLSRGVPAGPENLVLRAAEWLRQWHGLAAGASLRLEKHLPHGAGIGGGSSDAAAAVRLLSRLWSVALPPAAAAAALGADVPVCLGAPAPAIMRGLGEQVTSVAGLPSAGLVLVNPGRILPTAEVFRAFAAAGEFAPAGMDLPSGLDARGLADWATAEGNSLLAAALQLDPGLRRIPDRLGATAGCLAVGMSGSGSTFWGLFATSAAAASAGAQLARDEPSWWVRASGIGVS